ncbi:MAG TPA: hypothetical protein VGC49_07770 [Solirubrobacterales bacterium]
MMALIASFALASVAVLSTVNVQQGTNRDHNSKEAIAAADAGANIAMLRLNRFYSQLSPSNPCVGPNGQPGGTPTPDGWCPKTLPESVGGATFSYWFSAYNGTGEVNIVAVGSSGKVSRRVNVGLKNNPGQNVFLDERLIGEEEIEIEGSSARIETDLGTNGNIGANSHPVLCGDIRHGPGKVAPTPTCDGETSEGTKVLPPIAPPANLATENDNCRLSHTCTGTKAGLVDTFSKNGSKYWDPKTRTIEITGNGSLAMGGSDYFVCVVNISSGKIVMPVEAHVRIFIDTPEHCNLPSGAVQVEVGGGGSIIATGNNPAQGFFDVPGIYVLGNGAVRLEGNSGGNEVMVYAPNSTVDIGGSANWNALIAAKRMTIHGNVTIHSDPRIKPPGYSFASLLQRSRYVECAGASASPPNASC